MIEIGEFDEACTGCGGRGRIENPIWAKYWAGHEKLKDWFWRLNIEEQLGILKKNLPDQPAEPMFFTCKQCHGRGRVLTEDGEKLIKFVRFWMNPNY